MARARLQANRLTLLNEDLPTSSRSLTKDAAIGPGSRSSKGKSSKLELPVLTPRAKPEIPSPRSSKSDELVMPSLSSREIAKVRGQAEAPISQSVPVSSFRNGRDRRDQLELLKLKDLAQHYRRCGVDGSDELERSDTKSTQPETEVQRVPSGNPSAERRAEMERAFAHLELDFDVAFETWVIFIHDYAPTCFFFWGGISQQQIWVFLTNRGYP